MAVGFLLSVRLHINYFSVTVQNYEAKAVCLTISGISKPTEYVFHSKAENLES